METSSCTTDLLCFHSSNRPCAIPKSVSGSGIGKIFWALFEIHHKTIIWCLSIFSGVYLVNGRRCRCCISFVGNFRCTFIQRVRLRLCTSQCDPPPHPPQPGHNGAFAGNFLLFDERKGRRYRGLWPLLHVIQEQRGSGPGYFPPRWTGSRIANSAFTNT